MSNTKLTAVALFAVLAGCATANEAPATTDVDSGSADSTPAETSTDASSTDSAVPDDTATEEDTATDAPGSPCLYPDTQTRPCNKCGRQTRFCLPAGVWTGWGGCTGEMTGDTECKVGETRSADCGKCGKETDLCDPDSCTFNAGSCTGEGVCTPDDLDISPASCAVAGEVRTRKCDDTCKWGAFSTCTLPIGWSAMPTAPTALTARYHHTAVWTGTDMVIWGGEGTGSAKNDGAAYRASSKTWRMLAAAPISGRESHTAVWTGTKMLVWGGQDSSFKYTNDGASYDPATDSWTAIPAAPIEGRYQHTAVWATTTKEMIVWGGYGTSFDPVADGAAYDPAKNKWRKIAASPLAARQLHTAAWTGTQMLIAFGEGSCCSNYYSDGARYDPSSDTWITFPKSSLDGRYDLGAVFGGGSLFTYGGQGEYTGSSSTKSDGALYVVAGGWSVLPPFTAPSPARYGSSAWYDGKTFNFFGGAGSSSSASSSGASFDPATSSWKELPTDGAPTARYRATVVWTGDTALIWGGSGSAYGSPYFNDGAVYRP